MYLYTAAKSLYFCVSQQKKEPLEQQKKEPLENKTVKKTAVLIQYEQAD